MEQISKEFQELFEQENKEKAVEYILDKLAEGNIDVIDLYTNVLTPALNHLTCDLEDKRICIWKEHVKTGIVRTIVECCYPYIIKKRNQLGLSKKGIAAVLCPPEEYHDLGARMVADFLTIAGYESIYVGSNTPYQDFYNAVNVIKPEIIAICVSNYYHLVATKRMIEELKIATNHPFHTVVGGHAFEWDTESKVRAVGAHYYAKTFDDILRLADCEGTE